MRMAPALRWPLLHFLVAGGVLFALKSWLPDEADVIRISSSELQRLRADWQRDSGRAPSAAELAASVDRLVDDELLLREALRLGLERSDPVARERLVNNMRFAFPDSRAPDRERVEAARALGMHQRDLVVRRRLVQVMEMRIAAAASISEAELREYVAQHPERYARAPRYAFRQLFFSAARPQAEAAQAAQAELARLRSGASGASGGDPFLLGERFAARTEADFARQFGGEFARALTQLEPGEWSGPLRSPYGLHLVLLERVEAGGEHDFARIRQRAAYALLAEREHALLHEELARLRQRYRVHLPAVAADALRVGMLR